MKLYALKDLKMGNYGPVMMGMNDAHMSRSIVESLQGSQATPARFPEDYDLFQVAEYGADTDGSVLPEFRYVCNLSVIIPKNGGSGA